MTDGEICPNCDKGIVEPTQQGRLLDDEIQIRVMVPTCPECGWSVTKLRD